MILQQCLEIVILAILALKPNWSEAKIERYATPLCIESQRRDIDPLIGVAVIWHESGFNKNSRLVNRNKTIDHGLMQVNCDNPEKINMKWRKYWCDSKRRRRLYSIRGNIQAGFKELSVWKKVCFKKHGQQGMNPSFPTLTARTYKELKFQDVKLPKTKVLYSHWWVQHYNWNSRIYSDAVLYVYITLKLQKSDNYQILRTNYYRKLARKGLIKHCLKKEDLCLKEYRDGNKSRIRRENRGTGDRSNKVGS